MTNADILYEALQHIATHWREIADEEAKRLRDWNAEHAVTLRKQASRAAGLAAAIRGRRYIGGLSTKEAAE
jgi:hypothetical protein